MNRRVVIAVAVALLPAPIRADNEHVPALARELAREGRAAHDAGDYARAIAAFQEAYVIAPSPALVFDLAQSYRLQGNCDAAAAMYRRYLDGGPEVEALALAATHLASVERCQQARSLHIKLPDSGIALPPVPSPRHPRQSTAGLVAIGVGSAALGVAAYYGFAAHRAARDVERASAIGGQAGDVAARDTEGRRAAMLGRIAAVGGAAAVVAGVTLVILGKRAARATRIEITTSKSNPEVSVTCQF